MIAGDVQDAEYDGDIFIQPKENAVWESARQYTPEPAVENWELVSSGFQAAEGVRDGGEKFVAQTGALFLIPIVGRAEICMCGFAY